MGLAGVETRNEKQHVTNMCLNRERFCYSFPTSEYSPWGLLTYRSELTTYVHKPAILITCKISPYCICLRCPIRCLLYALRIAASSRSLGGFSSLPPRHVIPCSLFRIMMVKSWGSGSRIVKDKKARIRIPCPFTVWIRYPPRGQCLRLKSTAFC